MSNRGEYFIYILEQYKRSKAIGGKEALNMFMKYGIVSYLWASYEALHTMADTIVFQDIDNIVAGHSFANR
ncbi:hypothetical protein FACS189440_20810 [Bacteroidia bacterium]|nr:hypothetical protein FACS189440_20810 [Bacteroidia bacterium]